LRVPVTDTPTAPTESDEEIVLTGTLRGLHLDDDWIDVIVAGAHQRVNGVGDVVDDLIGPMVNREVRVRVRRNTRGAPTFIDIEQEE
jgi:hypothetical protein